MTPHERSEVAAPAGGMREKKEPCHRARVRLGDCGRSLVRVSSNPIVLVMTGYSQLGGRP
jgi:hypothetical protein